ncbi:MAG: hypothetical protein K6T59_05295 [Bryobacteraceae bacterium]|jgi:hypothetical protein|nr:hypothetical protein [Bryobacteraceae bacterium]
MPVETVKQSAILIPVGDALEFYQSLEDVPRPLRARLADPRWEFATILIADRRGRDEINKALKGHPGALSLRFLRGSARPFPSASGPQPRCRSLSRLWLSAGILFALASVAALVLAGR